MVIALVPARWLARRMRDVERARHVNVLISSVLVVAGLALVGADAVPGVCLSRTLLGVPCPFCGMTHAVAAAVRGDLAIAWRSHPAGPFVAAVLAAQLPLRTAALLGVVEWPWRRARGPEGAISIVVLLGCAVVFAMRAA